MLGARREMVRRGTAIFASSSMRYSQGGRLPNREFFSEKMGHWHGECSLMWEHIWGALNQMQRETKRKKYGNFKWGWKRMPALYIKSERVGARERHIHREQSSLWFFSFWWYSLMNHHSTVSLPFHASEQHDYSPAWPCEGLTSPRWRKKIQTLIFNHQSVLPGLYDAFPKI